MEEMATQKTANDYREERKARLAKAAKQNNRRSHRINGPSVNTKAGKIIGIVIAALVVIGIAAGICYSFGIVDRLNTVKTVDGHSYSAVEYEYYYRSVHNYYYNMASQYESQGQGMGVAYTGYDYTQQPEAQLVPEGMADFTNEDGSQPNWRLF